MTAQPQERTGSLVGRVWLEDDDGSGFRARITRSFGLSPEEEVVTTAGSVEDACLDMCSWVESFAADAPRAEPTSS
jgi:hypothetical protein